VLCLQWTVGGVRGLLTGASARSPVEPEVELELDSVTGRHLSEAVNRAPVTALRRSLVLLLRVQVPAYPTLPCY